MHENQKLIETFYTAFQNSDFKTMIACYHPEIEFSDPVFPSLTGKRAMAMWAFLNQRQADPKDRTFYHVYADAETGTASWEAKYVFPQTGRRVHNRIHAQFTFQDGKMRKHTDSFHFWKWSAMAFGPIGVLFGWTNFLKNKVRKQVQKKLDEFIKAHPEFQDANFPRP